MKKKDKLIIIIFIILIILILSLFLYHINDNFINKKVNRKVEYLFDNLTYNMVYSKSEELFVKGMDLLINKDILEYEKNYLNKYVNYSVDKCNNCKKIINSNIFINILTKNELKKYMNDNKIIEYDNSYYINSNIGYDYNKKYIGSIIDIDSYDDNYVYLKSINYYCNNETAYIGLLKKEPTCSHNVKESTFKVKFENNNLRLDNLDDLKNIVK